MLKDELLIRQKTLKMIIDKADKSEKKNPKINGHLRVASRNGAPQYYLVNQQGDSCGHYIKKKDKKIAISLAQRKYNDQMKLLAERQLRAIEVLLEMEKCEALITPYSELCQARRELITPYVISNEEYAKLWEAEEYQGNPYEFAHSYPTNKGDYVRSKSEVMFANYFYSHKIPYKYEYPTQLGLKTVYPDFTLLKKSTREIFLHEHFGLLDHPDYLSNALEKIELYAHHGYYVGKNLLVTYETSTHDLNIDIFGQMISSFVE